MTEHQYLSNLSIHRIYLTVVKYKEHPGFFISTVTMLPLHKPMLQKPFHRLADLMAHVSFDVRCYDICFRHDIFFCRGESE